MAETAKMFVHYNGTKANFIRAGHPTTYTNSIVFIKGDANGSCIYTHGTYFANFAEFIAAINYVKGVIVGSKTYDAAAGGSYVGFDSSDPFIVSLNVNNGKITVGLTTAFVSKVNNTAINLGSKTDAANKDGSAFARIAELAELVNDLIGDGTGSIENQITTAINDLRTEIVGTLTTDDAKTLQAINDELNDLVTTITSTVNAAKTELIGKTNDDASANTIRGAKAYAAEQAAAVAMAGEVTISKSGNKYTISQGGTALTTTINIPADMIVESGEVLNVEGIKTLRLQLANTDNYVDIPVNDLVDAYTAGTGITVSDTNVVSVNTTWFANEVKKTSYTKTEIDTTIEQVEQFHVFLTEEEYENLGSYEDKLYFTYEE